jgi:hypothetical protein
MKKLTKDQILARIEAIEECIEHLGLSWTDDPEEIEQGKWLRSKLEKMRDDIIDKHNVMEV